MHSRNFLLVIEKLSDSFDRLMQRKLSDKQDRETYGEF